MRKLATAAISFSAAVFSANYIVSVEYIPFIATILTAVGIGVLLLRRRGLKRIAIVLISSALGFACFFVHYQNTVVKAAEYDGQIHKIEAELLTYPERYDHYSRLEVRIKSAYLPNFKAYLYDNDLQLVDVRPGDTVTLNAKLTAADTIYGEEYSGYHSKGIYFKISPQGNIEHKAGGFNIFFIPQHISHWLSSRIEDIFPDDTEVFMRSLMLGDKSDFYGDEALYVSMSRAGLMHIVAVSGMHISFLVAMLYQIFGRGKSGALLCILLVWLFALATGFGPSVVRASFMCTTMLLAPVLKRENDNVTSLATVLAALLFANPFAASSMALQLSFAAMAGIVLLGGEIYSTISKKCGALMKHGVFRNVLYIASSSMSVMAFTIPLTAVHFGTVPLLSPLSNLLSMWAVSACFCGGWISCALSAIPFLGELSAWLCSWIARYIFLVAELISSVPFAVLYAETKGTWLWILLGYTVFFILLLIKLRMVLSFLLSALVSALLVAVLLNYSSRCYEGETSVTFLDVGQGQCVIVLTDEVTGVIDCGNTYSIDDAGTIAASRLYSRGRAELDFLLLSHLHEDHADGAVMLMESMKVHTLIMPADYDDSDKLYADIIACAERNDTEVLQIDSDRNLAYGDVELEIYVSGQADEENERCLIAKMKISKTEFLFLADSTYRMQQELAAKEDLSNVDILLVSHHGSKYSCSYELLDEIQGKNAVISVGHNYYGHPAEETLEALKTYGYNIYRTDIDENIQITIGN